jgi:hypothetical protein
MKVLKKKSEATMYSWSSKKKTVDFLRICVRIRHGLVGVGVFPGICSVPSFFLG